MLRQAPISLAFTRNGQGFSLVDWLEIKIPISYYTPNFRNVPFPQGTFSGTPNFLASLASYNGSDNSHLRFQQNGSLIQVLVEEDTTWDEEIGHTAENVSYLGIGGSGPLTALSSSLTDGFTRTFNLDITSQGVVNDLNVNLELIHTRGEDLDIFLESPEGTLVELLTDIDGNQDSFSTMTLDDEATEAISSAAMPFSGKLQPEGSLQSFDGDTITGTWILHVTDDTGNGHSGALLNWSLDIELGPQPEGNLNYSSQVDAIDIDMLFANLGSNDSTFDVDGDGSVDLQDVNHLVRNIMDRRFGDADLDRDVDHHDFRVLAENLDPQGVASFHGWAQGDFDGDEDVDVSDAFRLVTNYSPLGYGEPIVSSSVLTGAALPQLDVAAATLAMSRLGTEEGLVPILSKADATGQAESGPIRDSHPQTGVDRTGVEYFFVDDYFRSARRRHSDWFPGSITESD